MPPINYPRISSKFFTLPFGRESNFSSNLPERAVSPRSIQGELRLKLHFSGCAGLLLLPPGIVHRHRLPHDHSAMRRRLSTPASLSRLLSIPPFLRSSSFATFPPRERGRWRSEEEREREMWRGSGVVYSHLSRVKVTGRCAHKSVNPRGEGSAEASNPSR